MLNDNFKIGVIGAGQVGSVLANFASIANKLAFLVIRNVDKLNSELSDKLDATLLIKDISEVKTLPEVIILTVRDGQLTNTIEQFLNNRMVNFANTIFFHTSGSISRNILMALEQKGAICAACHPFQTFYSII